MVMNLCYNGVTAILFFTWCEHCKIVKQINLSFGGFFVLCVNLEGGGEELGDVVRLTASLIGASRYQTEIRATVITIVYSNQRRRVWFTRAEFASLFDLRVRAAFRLRYKSTRIV